MNDVKKDYEKKMNEILEKIKNKKETLLLHSCCAPCSSSVVEFLEKYFDITVFFYNPNITEKEEFYKREEEQKRYLIEKFPNVKFMTARYNPKEDFFAIVKGKENCVEGGERCKMCYETRLKETSELAKKNNFSYFGTVLSISPLKNSQWINTIGEELEKINEVKFLFADFKKKGRFQRGIVLSKENNLYRQDYCGCIFSKEAAKKRREDKKDEI